MLHYHLKVKTFKALFQSTTFVYALFLFIMITMNTHFIIQYSSRLLWHSCAVNTCVFFNFCRDSSQNMRVTRNELNASQLSCTACELFFVRCTQVIIRVMHNSNKHTSNASCTARKSVFLCAACKLTAVFCQRRIKSYNEKAPQQNVIKRIDTKKTIFCQVFT